MHRFFFIYGTDGVSGITFVTYLINYVHNELIRDLDLFRIPGIYSMEIAPREKVRQEKH